jgi:hypothetical protein
MMWGNGRHPLRAQTLRALVWLDSNASGVDELWMARATGSGLRPLKQA